MISRVLGAAVLAASVSFAPMVSTGPSFAGTNTVTVGPGMTFSPGTVQVPIGNTVTWSFQGTHTTTSNQGFWDSGTKGSGDVFSHSFASSGSYAYHCSIHSSMKGAVNVPVSASGSAGAGWTLRWSMAPGNGGTNFDVQVRKPGSSTWRPFRTDTTRATAMFNPTRAGTYALRARTTSGGTSGWSPAKSLKIA